MRPKCLKPSFSAALMVGVLGLSAAFAHAEEAWRSLERMPDAVQSGEPCIRPEVYAAWSLDRRELEASLGSAPMENGTTPPLRLSIPMPDGTLARFDIVESPVMPADLAARFPAIRTYRGQGVDDPALNLRFDVTPSGFHGSILSPAGEVYIDPYTLRDDVHYVSYYTRDHAASRRPWTCTTPHADVPTTRELQPGRSGTQLRTYRLACSLTGEATATFSNLQGRAPNVADGMAAVVSVINRVNQVLEVEVAVRAVLISNNDQLIFTNSGSDPFSSPNNADQVNLDHSNYLTGSIGFTNFDYAHVIHTGGDFGNAGAIGTACIPAVKGLGMSSANPVPLDNLAVKLVCHEMGHQFGANHSFNNCGGGQGGPQQYAIEPGGGSTIMSYAGICGAAFDLQTFPETMYNSGAYDQIIAYTTTGPGSSCPVVTATGNTPPGVDAGANYAIPKSTPFTLTAQGADANDDSLVYSWEDRSAGPQLGLVAVDNGESPLVRVRTVTASTSRTIPPMANVLSGTAVPGERLPTAARAWTYRVTARDSRSGGGGVATDDMVLNVVAAAGPFRVLGPVAGSSVAGQIAVTWDVAGTNLPPISTAQVRILFSTDGGETFPHVLASAVPNTGAANVLLPNIATAQGRLKIEAVGNVYFAVSPGNFTVQALPQVFAPTLAGAVGVLDQVGNCNRNGAVDPGESGVALSIPVWNVGAVTGTGVVGTLTSLTPGVDVLLGTSTYADMPYSVVRTNAERYMIRVADSHPCGSPVLLRLSIVSATGTTAFDVSVDTSFPSAPAEFNYAGARRTIPNPGAVELSIPIAGVAGPIYDVMFGVTGSACSDGQGSATVGLVHTGVNQLQISLRDPALTSVVLWNLNGGNGGGLGTRGDNLCNTFFSDAASVSVSTLLMNDAPYIGTWRPIEALSAFRGHDANGNWTVRIADQVVNEGGSVLACRVVVRHQQCSPVRCSSDLDNGSGTGTPDAAVTIDDLLFFLVKFEEGNGIVDMDNGSGSGAPDGAVTIDDLLYFLAGFESGC